MTSWATPQPTTRMARMLRSFERRDRELRVRELRQIEEDVRALRGRAGELYRDFLDERDEGIDLMRLSAACSFLSDAVTCLAAARKPSRGASPRRQRPGSDERSLRGYQDEATDAT